jgi:ABC-type Mn2+/Zn2+ transport system permease subunit
VRIERRREYTQKDRIFSTGRHGMNEDLFVRVVGGIGTIAILLVAVTVGALLGNDPDEMFAWSMIITVTLSIGTVIIIYRFKDKIDSM